MKITGAVYNGLDFLESNVTREVIKSGCHHEHLSLENGLKHLKKISKKSKTATYFKFKN